MNDCIYIYTMYVLGIGFYTEKVDQNTRKIKWLVQLINVEHGIFFASCKIQEIQPLGQHEHNLITTLPTRCLLGHHQNQGSK